MNGAREEEYAQKLMCLGRLEKYRESDPSPQKRELLNRNHDRGTTGPTAEHFANVTIRHLPMSTKRLR